LLVMRDIAPFMVSYEPADARAVSMERNQRCADLCMHHGKLESPEESGWVSSLGEPVTPLGANPPQEHVDDSVDGADTKRPIGFADVMKQTGDAGILIGSRRAELAIHGQEMPLVAHREGAEPGHHPIAEKGADVVWKRGLHATIGAQCVAELAYSAASGHNAQYVKASRKTRHDREYLRPDQSCPRRAIHRAGRR
jgi:hypothetical protein